MGLLDDKLLRQLSSVIWRRLGAREWALLDEHVYDRLWSQIYNQPRIHSSFQVQEETGG